MRARIARVLQHVALIALGGVAAIAAAELLLRVLPIPGIEYHTYHYDALTGGRHAPGSTAVYRGANGTVVKRRINREGFPDVEWEREPAPGTWRIGLFGDSYTEALQVPLEETFARIAERLFEEAGVPAGLRNTRGETVERVECLAFGISGRSVIQSCLEAIRAAPRFGLDEIVYVFVENDPVDTVAGLRPGGVRPFVTLEDDTFAVDFSFRERGGRESPLYRAMAWTTAHSLLAATIVSRLRLLRRYGIRMKPAAEGRDEARAAGLGTPSAMGDSLAGYTWEVTRRVILYWASEMRRQGLSYRIIRVPRELTLGVPVAQQDGWAPVLHTLCSESGIALTDPGEALHDASRAGLAPYGDHFTAAGHRVFAAAIVADGFPALPPKE